MTSAHPEYRPFVGADSCLVILPIVEDAPFGPTASVTSLLRAEAAELVAEFGCPVRLTSGELTTAGSPTVLVGPAHQNPAFAHLNITPAPESIVRHDRDRRLVVIDGPDVDAVGAAFQLLRTAFAAGSNETTVSQANSAQDVLSRIEREVWNTFPAFDLRGLSWPRIVAQHRETVLAANASLASLQQLFAELQDAHTWVKDANGGNARTPYRAWIDESRAYLTHVPTWSSAWAAGVRPGDALLDCDGAGWWPRTAATPRTRPLVTGMRWLAGKVESERTFSVRSPTLGDVTWTETYAPLPWRDAVSWHIRPSGTGYLRIRGWMHNAAWVSAIDAALTALSDCPRLIVDLRGNVGGNLIAAMGFRDRFLTGETLLGTVQFSIGNGRLADPAPMVGQPAPGVTLWHKPVRFLIDRQTYSASEDAILGLETLPHVELVGEASGGGSGRPRTITLRDGLFATVSTALTFTSTGHCVEANGIPVSIPLPLDDHHRDPAGTPASAILDLADRDW